MIWSKRMRKFARAAGAVLFAAAQSHAQVELKAVGSDHIAIAINGQPFSDFYIGNKYPKPFLAPLLSATGLIVTRKGPMENVEGESRDHPHHKGLWIGYGDINKVNFWESEAASQPSGNNPTAKGTILLRSVDDVSSGKKTGYVTATFEWQAPGHI